MRRYVVVPCTTSSGPGHVGPLGHEHKIRDAPHCLFVLIPRQKSWLAQTTASPSKLLDTTWWQFSFIVPSTDGWILRVIKYSPVTNGYSSKKKTQNIAKSLKRKQYQFKIITEISCFTEYCFQNNILAISTQNKTFTNYLCDKPNSCMHFLSCDWQKRQSKMYIYCTKWRFYESYWRVLHVLTRPHSMQPNRQAIKVTLFESVDTTHTE